MKSDGAVIWLAEHIVSDGDRERDPLALDPFLFLAVDALQVKVGDAVVMLENEGHGVAAAVGVVSGVEAKRDATRIGLG